MSIFIVDDSPLYRKIIEDYIAEMKFGATESFGSGEAILEVLQELPAANVKAILMDILMPGMDGIECCLRIRALPGYADIPILIVTAFDDERNMLFAFEAGATDYVKKPIQKYDLQVRLRTAIQLFEERFKTRSYELRLREDIRVAQEVQGRLLTSRLDNEGFRMELLYRPAANLSGDMVYVCASGANSHAGLLLDVMGHGVSSAFIAVLMRSAARDLFLRQADPATALTALGRQMWDIATLPRPETGAGQGVFPAFFSAVCFDYDQATRRLRWVNAGNAPALVKLPGGEVIRLESDSPPLGLLPDMSLCIRTMTMPDQSRLLAFSDGILDNYFSSTSAGIESLAHSLAVIAADSPADFLAALKSGLVPARPLAEMDDLCVMAIDFGTKGI